LIAVWGIPVWLRIAEETEPSRAWIRLLIVGLILVALIWAFWKPIKHYAGRIHIIIEYSTPELISLLSAISFLGWAIWCSTHAERFYDALPIFEIPPYSPWWVWPTLTLTTYAVGGIQLYAAGSGKRIASRWTAVLASGLWSFIAYLRFLTGPQPAIVLYLVEALANVWVSHRLSRYPDHSSAIPHERVT
jgi:hypothetical protein